MGMDEPAGCETVRGIFAELVPRARGADGVVENIPGTVRTGRVVALSC